MDVLHQINDPVSLFGTLGMLYLAHHEIQLEDASGRTISYVILGYFGVLGFSTSIFFQPGDSGGVDYILANGQITNSPEL